MPCARAARRRCGPTGERQRERRTAHTMTALRWCALCLVLSGCTIARGNIAATGEVHWWIVRPWLEKKDVTVDYHPDTRELHLTVHSQAKHLNLQNLQALLAVSHPQSSQSVTTTTAAPASCPPPAYK
jgi:hypothetical protein